MNFKSFIFWISRFCALGFVGSTAPSFAQIPEMDACVPPQEIRFERQVGPFWPPTWYVARYTRAVGETAYTESYKNAERLWQSGPSHAMRCARAGPGPTVQSVSMKLRTKRFFSTGVGDHLAILLRADFYAWPGPSEPPQYFYPLSYAARGIGLHAESGVWGEFFDTVYGYNQAEYSPPVGAPAWVRNPIVMKDDVEYQIEILTTPRWVTYSVIDPTGVRAARTWSETPARELTGDGFAVALLCKQNAATMFNCDVPPTAPVDGSFSVHFYDIKTTSY